MIVYSQQYQHDEPVLSYYDPNVLVNERAFTLHASEELLFIISGSGFRVQDEMIYQLEMKPSGEFVFNRQTPDQQLCLLVKNKSSTKAHHVARKTSLASVLELPRVKSYLCHVSIIHLAQSRLNQAGGSQPPSPYSPSQ